MRTRATAIARTAALLGALGVFGSGAACRGNVRYYALLGFNFGDGGPPVSDGGIGPEGGGTYLRIDVCTDPNVSACTLAALDPTADPTAGRYQIPISADPAQNRLILVARPESHVGARFNVRAWVTDGRCCGLFCSESFVSGLTIDSTLVGGIEVPQPIDMLACPATASCPRTCP